MTLTRRSLLTATALAAGSLAAGRPASASPPRLTLPAPTGPHPIGTVSLRLADRMASVWYPATPDARRFPRAVWLEEAPLRALLADNDLPAAAAPLTAGRDGAPALRTLGRRPVVLFSHGAGGHRSETTVIVQELAGHGYVVVTVDTPYDAYVQFPDGTVRTPSDDVSTTPWEHAHDVPFVLGLLSDIVAGRRRVPAGLAEIIDLRRVGMFGYSKGGTATALAMIEDRRIRAGVSLDGPMECQPPITTDIHRPFLMMTADFPRVPGSSAAGFWTHLRGWRRNPHLDGGTEISYTDGVWLLPQLLSAEELPGWIGTFDPGRAIRIQQEQPLAFFDRHLR